MRSTRGLWTRKGITQMAHEINELAQGVHSFVSAREHAWHRLGTVVESAMTAEEAMSAAYLAGWNVRKTPMFTIDEDGNQIEADNRFATIYTNPFTHKNQYLGVVGSHYTPIQNEEHVGLLNAIVDESGAHFETAGSLKGGREVFITMKMPSSMQVGGFDAVDQYIVAMNSHDGTSPLKFMVTPIRVVCANTLAAATRSAKSSFSVRHVASAQFALQEAREALALSFKYFDEFEVAAEKMIQQQMNDDEFNSMIQNLFEKAKAETPRQEATFNKHASAAFELWKQSSTMEGIRGTRWCAYQAVTEYTDHFMGVNKSNTKDEGTARALRAVTSSQIQELKSNAFALLTA